MTPEEYIQQLEQFAREGDADQLLAFAKEHGPSLQDSLTPEQWNVESDLGHWAIMLVDLREAAHQHV